MSTEKIARVRRAAEAPEFHTAELCFIAELSNTSDDPAVSIARARVPPGITTRWHRVTGTVERYCILSGEGSVEIGTLPPQPMGPGDTVVIPAGERQRITNTGCGDLVFLAICTPRFTPQAYVDVDASPT